MSLKAWIGFIGTAYLVREYTFKKPQDPINPFASKYNYESYSVLRHKIIPHFLGSENNVNIDETRKEYFRLLKKELFNAQP